MAGLSTLLTWTELSQMPNAKGEGLTNNSHFEIVFPYELTFRTIGA